MEGNIGNILSILILAVIVALALWFFLIRPARRNRLSTTSGGALLDSRVAENGQSADEHPEVVSEPGAAEEDTTVEEPDKTWQEHEKEGDEAFAEFRYDDAISSYEEALSGARDRFGRDAIELVDLLLKVGKAYQARDDGTEDEDYFSWYYRRALSIIGQKLGDKHARLLPVLAYLISALDQSGEHGNATALSHRYRRIIRLEPGAALAVNDTSEAERLFAERVAETRRLGEESEDIEDAFNQAIDTASGEFGSDSYLVALLCNSLGEVLQARDDEEDDEETVPFDYLRALAIIEQRFGPLDARLVPVLRNLASFYDQVGKFGEAETMVGRIELIEELAAQSAAEAKVQS